MDLYELMQELHVLREEEIISSHVVYKLKFNEKWGVRINTRIFPHGIVNKIKKDVPKYSHTMHLDVIRIYLSMYLALSYVT